MLSVDIVSVTSEALSPLRPQRAAATFTFHSFHKNRYRHSAQEQLEQDADVNARSRFRLIVGPQSTMEPGHEKVDLAAYQVDR